MKKTLFLFFVVLLIASCQGPEGPVGQTGPQGYGTNWKIINLTVSKTDWVESVDKNGLNRFYSSHFPMPEITPTVFNDGSVISYLLENSVQQPLPFVGHFQNTAGNYWTRTIDFDYSVGGMNVYVTSSDFAVAPPDAMNFRVVLMW